MSARKRGATGKSRARVSDERWREILDAAAEIIANKGYEATTVRDIAEAVGLLSGSLYYYIDSKPDLLYALIEDFHRLGSAGIAAAERAALADGGDALAVLRAVVVRHVEINAENMARAAVFHNDFRRLDKARRSEIVGKRRGHESRVEQLIRKAQAEGSVRQDLDARLAAVSILSMLNSIQSWYQAGSGPSPTAVGELQADLVLDGLRQRC